MSRLRVAIYPSPCKSLTISFFSVFDFHFYTITDLDSLFPLLLWLRILLMVMLTPMMLTWVLYILPIGVLGRSKQTTHAHLASTDPTEDDGREKYKPVSIAQAYEEGFTGESNSINYTLPWPATKLIQPAVISQEMIVTSMIPIYETCNLPGARTTSCSPSFQTIITTKCSTVLKGYFTRHTVSECDEIVTFSTQYGYSLATTKPPAHSVSASNRRDRNKSGTTTYVHNITTYYAAPWQSIAADDPSNIHVIICGLSSKGIQVCTTVNEVWVIHTEYLPVYYTEAISVSTTFSSVCNHFVQLQFLDNTDFLRPAFWLLVQRFM